MGAVNSLYTHRGELPLDRVVVVGVEPRRSLLRNLSRPVYPLKTKSALIYLGRVYTGNKVLEVVRSYSPWHTGTSIVTARAREQPVYSTLYILAILLAPCIFRGWCAIDWRGS